MRDAPDESLKQRLATHFLFFRQERLHCHHGLLSVLDEAGNM